MLSDFQLLAEFRHQLRMFMVFSENAARAVGLAPQQHQALLAIKGFSGGGAPTVGDLAQQLAIRHHSAVGLADRLVEARLLVRNIDASDRRKTTLVLTKRAEKLLTALSATHRDELRRTGPLLRNVLARLEH
ncbi:MAG TPA: helix-turn-helix domain-containing protein [Rhizomicrobium sp.]|nr:helix-turn-helix domain-containing protein [Rhizomicrobium sp.]